jgi:hypothetical protein
MEMLLKSIHTHQSRCGGKGEREEGKRREEKGIFFFDDWEKRGIIHFGTRSDVCCVVNILLCQPLSYLLQISKRKRERDEFSYHFICLSFLPSSFLLILLHTKAPQ